VVKYNLKALIAEKEFNEKKRITYAHISKKTGISRTTLSKLSATPGYATSTDILEKLCVFFKCSIDKLVTIIPDPQNPKSRKK
jgi:putative transcriptional regulator